MIKFVRSALATSVFVAFASLAGCAVSTGEEAGTTGQDLWKCGGVGGECLPPPPVCNPATHCCLSGGMLMGAPVNNKVEQCGAKLKLAGCVGADPMKTKDYAPAVETDGPEHWWFQVYCPHSAQSLQSDPDCATAGIRWPFGGNVCSKKVRPSWAPAAYDNVEYDPNCGGNCFSGI